MAFFLRFPPIRYDRNQLSPFPWSLSWTQSLSPLITCKSKSVTLWSSPLEPFAMLQHTCGVCVCASTRASLDLSSFRERHALLISWRPEPSFLIDFQYLIAGQTSRSHLHMYRPPVSSQSIIPLPYTHAGCEVFTLLGMDHIFLSLLPHLYSYPFPFSSMPENEVSILNPQ